MYTNQEVAEKFGDVVLEFQSLYKGVASFRGLVYEEGRPATVIEASIGEMTYESAYELSVDQLEKFFGVDKWGSIKITEDNEVVFDYWEERW